MPTNNKPQREGFFMRLRRGVYPFFWFAAAADETILRQCIIVEQDKQAGVGIAIVCTTIAAAISSFYAFNSLFPDVLVNVLIALFWAFIIFNLDRFLVSSIRKKKKLQSWRILLVIVPRLALATIIAIMISKPLEVRIFRNQIADAESNFYDSLQHAKFKYEKADLETVQEDSRLADTQVSQLKSEANNVNSDGLYQQYKTDYDECITEKTKLDARLAVRYTERKEAIAAGNKADSARLQNEIKNLRQRIASLGCPVKKIQMDDRATAWLTAQQDHLEKARDRQEELNRKLDSARAQLGDKKDSAVIVLRTAGKDILGQLRILSDLKQKDVAIWWADALVMTIFFILEICPLMVKIFSPRGHYDAALSVAETQAFDNEEASIEESGQERDTRKAAAKATTLQVASADQQVMDQVHAKILAAQVTLAEKIVDAWRVQEETELQTNREEYLKNLITKNS